MKRLPTLATLGLLTIFAAGCQQAVDPLVRAPKEALHAPADTPYVVVLGIAQDGGVPQAGAKDPEAWEEPRRRRVVSLALVDPRTGKRYLFEATPDLREQLAELDALAPSASTPGLDGVFLTHAHMGHYTGLMFFGFESMGTDRVPVYAMPRMSQYLSANGPWDQLVRYDNIELRPLADGGAVQLAPDLTVTPFLVPHRQEYSEVVGYRIDGPSRSVLFIPDINSWEEWDEWGVRIEERLADVDVAYLDGSFWNHGEIPGRDMTGFPHPMIAATLERLAALPESERSKVRFLHLNHTNPALDPTSAEAIEILSRGFHISEESERIEL